MSRTTRTTRVATPVATITRPTTRGDWIAVCDAGAFTDDTPASGAFTTVIPAPDADTPGTVRVRFGGRAGAMVAAIPDDNRAAVVVASVAAMRDDMGTGYATFARPGAIDSPAVARGIGIARDRSDGSAVRDDIGRIAASRRVDNAPAVAARAAESFGTTNPYGDASDA